MLNFVLGLKESGFIEYANLLIKQYPEVRNLAPDQIGDIEAYHRFIQELEKRTLELYQATVIREESQSAYKRDFYDFGEQLWNNLNWEINVPGFSESRFEAELRSRFNTLYEFQKSNGIFGLHMGHIVLDDKRRIRQHGKEADLRYIAIEHMVSNGYSSWFWDGEAASGGWTKEDFFLQVRSSYNRGPLTAWLMVSDSAEVERKKAEIAEKSKLDDQIATNDPYAYLPGTGLRISFNARMRLYDSLSHIYQGPDLRMAFINQYEQRTRKSSIFAHEGRHAIDDIFSGFIWASEDEFRAKLSEIYFADDPFDALRAIFAQNIGSGTSHGKANLKVMKGLVKWINGHRKEIRAFDLNRPVLPQLELLTPAQLRLAVKSMDPLVN